MKTKFWIPLMFLLACAGGVDKTLEEVRFHLDKGEFQAAVTKARQAVADDPTNTDAQFLLASALMGGSVLSPSANCEPEDTGYLGLLACLQDNQEPGESGFVTFVRIAPSVESKILDLEEARDLLVTLTGATVTGGQSLKDVFLQLWMARLFEISGVTTRLALCTDNFDATAVQGDDLDRFQDNLSNVNDDADAAGLPESAAMDDRLTKIADDIETAVDLAGGDVDAGVAAYFTAQNDSCK